MNSMLILPTEFNRAITSDWIVSPEIRNNNLQEYFLLYHSASYIRNNSWEAGRILRNGTFYHVIFYGDCKYDTIRKADPFKQFALSFRKPLYPILNQYKYIVPVVLIADPMTISMNGNKLFTQSEAESRN